MTACAMCGDCCRVIGLRWPKQAFRERRDDPAPLTSPNAQADHDFILRHWTEVSVERAERLLPGFTAAYQPGATFFYVCDAFDYESNLCTAHDERPPVCSDFPWYNTPPGTRGAINRAFRRCSYWADVPREQWPEGIAPLPSPPIQIQRKMTVK